MEVDREERERMGGDKGRTKEILPFISFHSYPLLLRKRCDLQNNNGEKRGGEFAHHAVHRRNNVFEGNVFLKIKRYGKGLPQ